MNKSSLVATALALGILGTATAAAAGPGANAGKAFRPAPAKRYAPPPARRHAPPPAKRHVREPVITSAPQRAVLGKAITIRGKNLPARATLRIGTTVLRPVNASSTALRFAVPSNLRARTYRMVLSSPVATKQLGRITLSHPRARRPVVRQPVITSAPDRAVLGTTITIRGRNLPARATLRIGGTILRPVYTSSTALRFAIPSNLRARTYRMVLASPVATKPLGRISLSNPRRVRRRAPAWSFNVSWLWHFKG